MEIKYNEKCCIIVPLSSNLSSYKLEKIFDRIEKEERRVALDLSNFQDCNIEFIQRLMDIKRKDLGIFNIPSDIFVLFNMMNLDKFAKLFVSQMDFENDLRQIINRKFSII